MKTLNEALGAADPLRHEAGPTADQRARLRHTIIAAAAHAGQPSRARRRMPIALAVALASIVIVLIAASSSRWGSTAHAAVRFEVRLAEEQAAPGLTAARVANSDRTVYLHAEAVVTNADIAFSNVIPGNTPSEQFWIDVRLNAAGADKMRRATLGHLGRLVAILIDGDVVSTPRLKSPIGPAAVISGDFTRAEAEKIAEGMRITP